jgi:hypothetical protein
MFLFLAICSSKNYSQCSPGGVTGSSFGITNSRNCNITIHYETSDCCNPEVNYCSCGINHIIIQPSATYNINSACVNSFVGACGAGDVTVCLVEIDGVAVGVSTCVYAVSWSSTLPPGFGAGPSNTGSVPAGVSTSCQAPSNWNMSWSATGVTVW